MKWCLALTSETVNAKLDVKSQPVQERDPIDGTR